MHRTFGAVLLIGMLGAAHIAGNQTPSLQDVGWRISPEKINLEVGEDRSLQALDDSAAERSGALWSVDDASLVDVLDDEPGRVTVHAKAPGTLRVKALLGGETRYREIKIWPTGQIPLGTTRWGVHPIGREVGDIPAVPIDDAPNMFSLEQTAAGKTYLRATRDDGIQVWTWLMPENARDVELVCGDWLGGAIVSANRADSYTVYAVGKNGTLRWRHEASGRRQGHAISTDHLVHLLSRTADGSAASIDGIDEESGIEKFHLALPASTETYDGLRNSGGRFTCASDSTTGSSPITATKLLVSADGLAYVAFTQRQTRMHTATCTPGTTITPTQVIVARNEKLVLWQIHPDGTYRSTVVESVDRQQPAAAPITVVSPTGAIIPDGPTGLLLSVEAFSKANAATASGTTAEFVYHLNADGEVLYKFRLPSYAGVRHDGMVLGEHEEVFATRGGLLIVFNVRTGRELWRWDSRTREIEVFAALANGHCAVQTPTALVEVSDPMTSKELAKGKAMIDWLGHMYVKPFEP